MKKIRSCKELYDEILKSFYFCQYKKDDQYMTQVETKEYYGVARPTAEKVFKMLQNEGFISSKRHHGSIVTFDRDNPEHMAKVPLCHPDTNTREFNTFTLPIIVMSYGLHEALIHANSEQLRKYCQDAQEILQLIDEGRPYNMPVVNLHLQIISDIANPCITNMMDHFLSRYFYFNSNANLTPANRARLRECVRWFYQQFIQLIKKGDFAEIVSLVREYYGMLHQIPDALVFSIVDDTAKLFQEQSRYGKLLHTLLVTIHASGLKKGDPLPTIAALCKSYNVSEKTVRNAYGVLAEIGLVGRKQRVGTRLIADPEDPKIQQWTVQKFLEQKDRLKYMLEALILIGRDVLRETIPDISPVVIEKMRFELIEQAEAHVKNQIPFFVADVLMTPVIMAMPMGVLQKYYFYVQQPTAEFLSMGALEFGLGLKNSDEIYHSMCVALNHLEIGNFDQFVTNAVRAQRMNSDLLICLCEEKISSWMMSGVSYPDE